MPCHRRTATSPRPPIHTIRTADARTPGGAENGAAPRDAVLVVIAAGGALGAPARFEAGRLWPTAGDSFPLTTLLVNATGCLVIGVFLITVSETLSVHRTRAHSRHR